MGKAPMFYFPGQPEPNAQKLFSQWFPGLGDSNLMWGYFEVGPDELSGAFAYFAPPEKDLMPSPAKFREMTWRPLPANQNVERPDKAVFFGFDGAVSPAAVRRREQLRGTYVPLADGHEWLIPAVQQLPHKFTLGDDGQHERAVDPKYEAWASRALRNMAEVFQAIDMWDLAKQAVKMPESDARLDEVQTIELSESIDFICESIELNYLLNKELILLLGLLDERANQNVIAATFDMPAIFELCNDPQKKTEEFVTIPVGSNS